MARRLELGEAGEVRTDAQVQDPTTGRWSVKRGDDARRPGRYRGRCYFRTQDGVLREVTRYAPTAKAVRQLVADALSEREHARTDNRVQPSSLFVTVGAVWLEKIARSDSGLSARSVADYGATFRRYIDAPGSSLRGLSLTQAADRQRLRAFLRHLAEQHGDGAVHMSRSVLSGIFGMAERDGVIPANPILGIGVIRRQTPKLTTRDKRRAMTREERDHLLDVAYDRAMVADLNPRSERRRRAAADLVAVLAGTGCRITEGRMLRWEHIDLESGRIHIDGTKSQAAARTVTAPRWLLEKLRNRAMEFGTDGYVVAAPSLLDQPDKPW